MKITLLSFSILFLSTYTLTFSSAAEAPEAVRDTAGNNLRTDAYYYIAPDDSGNGGGLSIDSVGKYGSDCPIGVVQEPYDYRDGFPLKFYNANQKKSVVRVSTDLNIEFLAPHSCGESNVWRLGDFDPWMRKYFVGVNGVVGSPNINTIRNWFKIEKYANYYKLMYCPTFLRKQKSPICKDVGIVYQNGKRRLALTNSEPLIVKFVKISE